ncbi:MAG: TatD family hydrolase, partial [Akkermansiaceae bacterium]
MNDAHLHLQDARFHDIRESIILQMRDAGVARCVVNGTSPDDWPLVAELARQHEDLIIPSFGLHPWKPVTKGWLDPLEEYLTDFPSAGIGECGLDRWVQNHDIAEQTEVFKQHIRLAAMQNRALSIHCLKAWGLLMEVLQSQPLPERGFLLHSYSGSRELIAPLVELGAYFSFSGYFLHERKANVRETFRHVPADRLLLETDAPDMAPPPILSSAPCPQNKYLISAKINHPANLRCIYQE